jgi:hypothetical protein
MRQGKNKPSRQQVLHVQSMLFQVHQVDGKDERRFIHGIRLETKTNRWTHDASIESTLFKYCLCQTGEDQLKVCQILLRIANSKHSKINVWVLTVIWHLAPLDTVS